jgi:hypothetical protein
MAARASRAVRVLALAAFGLSLLVGSVRAQERLLTLSIVNFNSLLSPRFETVTEPFSLVTSQFLLFKPESVLRPGGEPSRPEALHLSATLFGNLIEPAAANQIPLTRSESRERNLFGLWSWLGAGYGQIFYDRKVPAYTQHGAGQEEPTFGYLKVTFSF